MAKVTLKHVADQAGVGVATVDRVLNGRAPVSSETAARVLAAAETLGYRSRWFLRRRIEEMAPAKRLGFILQKSNKWFYQELATKIRSAAEGLRSIRATVDIRFVESLSPPELAQAVTQMASMVDAIALVSLDHPLVRAAIEGASVPVYALLSPLSTPAQAGYVGIDNHKAGRTAGWAMATLTGRQGEVGVLIGSHRYLGHKTLAQGFRTYIHQHAPAVQLHDPVVFLDDAALAYEATLELLRARPGLSGIYHCGGGVSGALQAIREAGLPRHLFYICHGRNATTQAALQDGIADLIIDNPIGDIARKITGVMARDILGKPPQDSKDGGNVPFQLITPENL